MSKDSSIKERRSPFFANEHFMKRRFGGKYLCSIVKCWASNHNKNLYLLSNDDHSGSMLPGCLGGVGSSAEKKEVITVEARNREVLMEELE
jgi:hypothetical protein